MNPERIRELLGGLATGILTPDERKILFEAALHDQTLFNEVADELEFGAFLQSAETRAQLANRIEVEPQRRPWGFLSPRWLGLSGVLAAAAILFVVVGPRRESSSSHAVPQQSQPSAPTVTPTPLAPPAPEPAKPETKQAGPAKTAQSAPAVEAQKEEIPADKGSGAGAPMRSADQQPAPAAPTAERRDLAAARSIPAPAGGRPIARSESRGMSFRSSPGGVVNAPRAMAPSPNAAPPPVQPASPVPAPAPPPQPPPVVTASIEGTVHDVAGGAVPNAAIAIVNTATNSATHAASDATGRFVVPSLPADGTYDVIIEAQGYRKEQRPGITLAANQPATLDIALQSDVALPTEAMASRVGATASKTHAAKSGFATPLGALGGQVPNPTQQIAVFDFVNNTPESQSGQQAADLLSRQLVGSPQLRVIDRERVQQVQSQSQTAPGRAPTAQEAAQLGLQIGADAVIVGTIQPAKDQTRSDVAVTAAVIDTKKAVQTVTVAANGTLRSATNQVGIYLTTQLTAVEGLVTKVEKDRVVVGFRPPGIPVAGTRLAVYHGSRKIGELILTTVRGQAAEGTFSGEGKPRKGDRVTWSH